MQKIKGFVEELLSDPPWGKGRIGEAVIMTLIVVVSAVMVAYAYVTSKTWLNVLRVVETAITCVFLVEYLLRWWIAKDKKKHAASVYTTIDLVAILPLFIPGNQHFFQVIRIFRFLRILRMIRYLRDQYFFFGTISRKTLVLARIFFTVTAIIFVASGLVFYAEREANAERFRTMADAVYFSIVTMSTVGFGDITPVTTTGRWMTVLIIFSGIILLPWQIKDLIEQIVVGYTKVKVNCTKCDLEPHDPDARFCRRCGTPLPEVKPAGSPPVSPEPPPAHT